MLPFIAAEDEALGRILRRLVADRDNVQLGWFVHAEGRRGEFRQWHLDVRTCQPVTDDERLLLQSVLEADRDS